MTPQEQELLVQVIVRCVRAVLSEYNQGALQGGSPSSPPPTAPSASTPARIVDVVPNYDGGRRNGTTVRGGNGDRSEVRQSLQRFLRDSENRLLNGKAGANGAKATSANGSREPGVTESAAAVQPGNTPAGPPASSSQRQLITQAEVLAALQRGERVIVLQSGAIVTPLARQVAKEKGVELR